MIGQGADLLRQIQSALPVLRKGLSPSDHWIWRF
jgi:hypothetical protein